MRLFQLFLTCLIVSFTISCEKNLDDQTDVNNLTIKELQDQFFDVGFLETNNPNVHSTTGINTRSTDPLITEIMADMQLAEYETAYINELIDHLGFPAWNHAEVVPHDGNEEIAVLPFAHVEGSSISGVLLATRKENGMKYRLIDKGAMLQIGRQYSDHSFYLASLLYLAHMDKVVFDEVECQLAAMLNAASSNLVEEGIITVRSCYTVTVFWERCVRWLIHVASEDDPEGGYFYEDETCTTYPVTITVCESDAQDILGTATPGDDYFVPPPHITAPDDPGPRDIDPSNTSIIENLLNISEEEADCFNSLSLAIRAALLNMVMNNEFTAECNSPLSTADIVGNVIREACATIDGNIDEKRLEEAVVDDIIAQIENLPEDCSVGLPISCKSFNFVNTGAFMISKLSGTELSWTSSSDLGQDCNFDYEISSSNILWITSNGGISGHDITPGIAANAAAAAHNEAVEATVFYFGQLYGDSPSLIDCAEVEQFFIEAFNIGFILALTDEAINYYNINPFEDILDFETPPLAFLGFDPIFEFIAPTTKITDFSFYGYFIDDCTN